MGLEYFKVSGTSPWVQAIISCVQPGTNKCVAIILPLRLQLWVYGGGRQKSANRKLNPGEIQSEFGAVRGDLYMCQGRASDVSGERPRASKSWGREGASPRNFFCWKSAHFFYFWTQNRKNKHFFMILTQVDKILQNLTCFFMAF